MQPFSPEVIVIGGFYWLTFVIPGHLGHFGPLVLNYTLGFRSTRCVCFFVPQHADNGSDEDARILARFSVGRSN